MRTRESGFASTTAAFEEDSLERPAVLHWLRNDVGREIPRAGR
jgi:hypothetical protein